MFITRRKFLQYCVSAAAVLGLSQTDLLKLEKALTDCSSYGAPHVIWYEGQSCTGCPTSLLNRINQTGETVPELEVVQDVVDFW